jgi:hypothetical protein
MRQLVIGSEGEVGSALKNILGCDGYDPRKGVLAEGHYDVLHIAIPYSDRFEVLVRSYQIKFNPSLVIVHSTVPVGTCRRLKAVHSPIRGVHPHMEEGIRTFVKFFGGEQAEEASKLFSDLGIKTEVVDNPEDTEVGKLVDTFQYGVMIALNKAIYAYCERRGVDFDVVYKRFNQSYNDGYTALGRIEVVRPFLKHVNGKIGGHCVRENTELFKNPGVSILKPFIDLVQEAGNDELSKYKD